MRRTGLLLAGSLLATGAALGFASPAAADSGSSTVSIKGDDDGVTIDISIGDDDEDDGGISIILDLF